MNTQNGTTNRIVQPSTSSAPTNIPSVQPPKHPLPSRAPDREAAVPASPSQEATALTGDQKVEIMVAQAVTTMTNGITQALVQLNQGMTDISSLQQRLVQREGEYHQDEFFIEFSIKG